jgi:hypothetical protein
MSTSRGKRSKQWGHCSKHSLSADRSIDGTFVVVKMADGTAGSSLKKDEGGLEEEEGVVVGVLLKLLFLEAAS